MVNVGQVEKTMQFFCSLSHAGCQDITRVGNPFRGKVGGGLGKGSRRALLVFPSCDESAAYPGPVAQQREGYPMLLSAKTATPLSWSNGWPLSWSSPTCLATRHHDHGLVPGVAPCCGHGPVESPDPSQHLLRIVGGGRGADAGIIHNQQVALSVELESSDRDPDQFGEGEGFLAGFLRGDGKLRNDGTPLPEGEGFQIRAERINWVSFGRDLAARS